MPPRSWQFRIRDIIDASQRIAAYVEDKAWEDFDGNSMLQEAVAYNLIIIGEATAALPSHVIDDHPDIPWQLMRGMRNVLAHKYFSTDAEVLWTTATEDLPPLLSQLEPLS